MGAVIACLIFLAEQSVVQAQTDVFPFPVSLTEFENGLKVVGVEYDSPGIVAYYTIVRTGSRNEVEQGFSGYAHFFEHMMFRGTEKYPTDAYNAAIKRMGADSNAFTTDDWRVRIHLRPLLTSNQIGSLTCSTRKMRFEQKQVQFSASTTLISLTQSHCFENGFMIERFFCIRTSTRQLDYLKMCRTCRTTMNIVWSSMTGTIVRTIRSL